MWLNSGGGFMKPAFFNISEVKRMNIINACIIEFGRCGYEKSSTDRIIKAAGISKGGLYEYISSKEELFLYITEYTYRELYGFIRNGLKKNQELPPDILDRFNMVTSIAVEFYIKHPEYIRFIANTHRITDQTLENKTKKIFMKQFLNIFGTISGDNLRFNRERLIDLLIWLLTKTRDDFLHSVEKNRNIKKLKKNYLENWDFYISVLKTGIYK